LWLQDILPDGAAATALVHPGRLLRTASRFERLAYRSAQRIVVLSDTFKENLRAKGVPESKLVRIYNPASRPVRSEPRLADAGEPGVVLTMGNIGYSQNLATVVRAFESHEQLSVMGARFVLAGDGVAGPEVRAAITTNRVRVTGIVGHEALAAELHRAQIALVSQHYEGAEFNVPSKLMNFMGDGLATIASVGPRSEVARILTESGGGWVTPSSRPEAAMDVVAAVLRDPVERDRRAAAALAFARANFQAGHIAEQFEQVLVDCLGRPATS
jgi:colanic acid biosynthesis glycosyl transferase WcaI